jgi:hypothetical protein
VEKKILYINPVRDDDPKEMAILNRVTGATTQLEYRSLGKGPEHLQYKIYRAAILTRLLFPIKSDVAAWSSRGVAMRRRGQPWRAR